MVVFNDVAVHECELVKILVLSSVVMRENDGISGAGECLCQRNLVAKYAVRYLCAKPSRLAPHCASIAKAGLSVARLAHEIPVVRRSS